MHKTDDKSEKGKSGYLKRVAFQFVIMNVVAVVGCYFFADDSQGRSFSDNLQTVYTSIYWLGAIVVASFFYALFNGDSGDSSGSDIGGGASL